METMAYPFEMRPLTEAEGGGWLITFPDFPGCLGDGATIAEAVADGKMALESVSAVFQEDGRPFPKPR
jgi:antitoxin HicB